MSNLPFKNIRLGEFFRIRKEQGIEGLPVLSVTINQGMIRRDALKRKMESTLAPNEHLLVKKGDIPYNMMRMWQGALGAAHEDGIISPAYVVCMPKKDVCSEYFAFLFRTPLLLKHFQDYAYGITGDRLRLYFRDFEKIRVDAPSYIEQKKIAGLLNTWDKAITLTEKLIADKQLRRKGLMQQLLTFKSRLPGWREVRLNEIFASVRRKNTVKESLVLTASGKHGLIDQSKYFNRNVAGKDLAGYFLLHKGEFAYNRSSMNGYPYGAIKRLDEHDTGLLSTLYICFTPASDKCCPDFYLHLFEAGVLNRQLRGIVQVGARAHGLLNVSVHDFFNLKVPFPTIEEQKEIAFVLNNACREIELLKVKVEALREQKKGLMQQLLTGKVRVTL